MIEFYIYNTKILGVEKYEGKTREIIKKIVERE